VHASRRLPVRPYTLEDAYVLRAENDENVPVPASPADDGERSIVDAADKRRASGIAPSSDVRWSCVGAAE
jgi:hypothetical protein